MRITSAWAFFIKIPYEKPSYESNIIVLLLIWVEFAARSIKPNLLKRLVVKTHSTSLTVVPEVLNRASSVFPDSPVSKPENEKV